MDVLYYIGGETGCWSSRAWLQDDAFKALKEKFNKPSRWEEENV